MHKISVYIDTGVVFDYEVDEEQQAREHAQAIVFGGYRSAAKDKPTELTFWPPHRITKIKVMGGITSHYWDTPRGT